MMGKPIVILMMKTKPKVKTINFIFSFLFFGYSFSQSVSDSILTSLNIVLEQAYNDSIDYDNKLKHLKNHYYLLNKIENDSTRLRNKFKVVNRISYLKDKEHEYAFLTDIKYDAYDVKDSYNIARVHNYLGDYFMSQFILDSALFHISKSEKLFLEIGDKTYLSYNYSSKSQIYLYINDYNKALEYDFLSLKLAQEENKLNAMFWAYSNIFITQGKLKNEEKTFEYFEKAIKLLDENKDYFKHRYYTSKPEKQNLLGVALEEMGNYALAEEYYKEAASAENLKEIYPSLHAALIDNLAYIRYLQGDSIGVKKELERALFLKDSLNTPGLTVKTKYRLAKLHYDNGELEKSKAYAYEALITAKTYSQTSYVLQSIQQLALSEPEKQATHFQEYIRLNDSIIEAERIQRNKFARIEYETEQLEKDNILVKLDNQKLANRNIIIASAGLFSLLLFGFVYYNYRKKAQRKLLLLQQQEQATKEEILDLIIQQKYELSLAKSNEQQRISRDLHDDVSGKLSSINLNLFSFKRKVLKDHYPLFDKNLIELQALQKRVREISHDLNQEQHFENTDFGLAVKGVLENLKEQEIDVEYSNSKSFKWNEIPTKVKLQLFRVLQEATANILKHAQATQVTFMADRNEDSAILILKDNGIGFNPASTTKGMGLQNMQKRMHQVGSKLSITSQKEKGTEIRIHIKIEATVDKFL